MEAKHIWVWLSRWNHCRGFGIQSPADYAFVRNVVNEHWPYYAYAWLGVGDSWLKRKLGLLYFRLANWRQPSTVIDRVGARCYLQAGCQRTLITQQACGGLEMAVVPVESDCVRLFTDCTKDSLVVVEGICRDWPAWRSILSDERVRVSFDLYYCGILMFDKKRFKQNYIINF